VRAGTTAGGRELTVWAPIFELPIFARAGAVIPLLPPDVDTLAGLPASPGVVELRRRSRSRVLLAFPRGRSTAPGIVSTEGRGVWRLRVSGRARTEYRLQASMSTLRRPLRPCRVTLGGRPVRWKYFHRRRTLHAEFRARSATLTVRSCR
jgi:hypothetical protein